MHSVLFKVVLFAIYLIIMKNVLPFVVFNFQYCILRILHIHTWSSVRYVHSTVPQTHQTCHWNGVFKICLITSQENMLNIISTVRTIPLSNKVLVFLGLFKCLLLFMNHMFLRSYCGAVMAMAFLIIYDDSESALECNTYIFCWPGHMVTQ